jgi:prolipoprotein diacylglyceryltransferase
VYARAVAYLAATRCAAPTVRARSTYTLLGFAGYGLGSVLAAALFVAWEMPLLDRLIAAFVPGIAFLVVVRIARAITGAERIVFYQVATTSVVVAATLGVAFGAQPARITDVVAIGIGTFLVLGRIGCFAVACCHGRPARFGVVYGAAHVAVGFWPRWQGRRLWPTQLVESVASLLLVAIAVIAGWRRPGWPAVIYLVGYAPIRFALERVRGDWARPHRGGLSEAQWTALATVIACAIWRPHPATIAVATVLAIAAAVLIVRRRRRELFEPPHLRQLDLACAAADRQARAETSLGVAVSRYPMPDGRIDWVLSSSHPRWSPAAARRMAALMWPAFDLIEARTPGIVHVITA